MSEGQDLWRGLGDAVRQLRREAVEQATHVVRLVTDWLARLLRRLP